MTPNSDMEVKLSVIAEFMAHMDTPTLRQFRSSCLAMHPGADEEREVIGLIDGQLALREIAKSPD